jgi:hypothetical protein
LQEYLQALRKTGWQFPPPLHGAKMIAADGPLPERGGENVGSRDGILHGKVDADAADRRHRVGGVTDAQQPGPIPLAQAIDANGQEFDIVPTAEFTDAIARKRHERRDLVAQRRQPPPPDFIGGSLRDDIRALPIIPTIDHGQDPAGLDATETLLRIARPPRQP